MHVISVNDDAIDTEAMSVAEMLAYAKTRDVGKLRFKQNARPTRYHVREVPHALMESWVLAASGEAEQCRRAFLAAVVQVDNLPQRDGTTLPSWTPPGMPTADSMPDAEAVRFSAADRTEIGMVALERSFLAPRIVRAYHLPPSSVRLLELREFRRVDASPASPAPSSAEASPESGRPSPAASATPGGSYSDAAPCGSPTDATAPATLAQVA